MGTVEEKLKTRIQDLQKDIVYLSVKAEDEYIDLKYRKKVRDKLNNTKKILELNFSMMRELRLNQPTFYKQVKIVIKKEGEKWVLYTSDGSKKLGEFSTELAAKEREKQINYFKYSSEKKNTKKEQFTSAPKY